MPTYTLFLAKEKCTELDQVLKENALEISFDTKISKVTRLKPTALGDGSEAIVVEKRSSPPPWLGDITSITDFDDPLLNSSHTALVSFVREERLFVATLGHSYHLINPYKVVSDFGLKVSINSLNSDAIKGLERSDLSKGIKSVSQSPFQRSIESFGTDEAFDLIKKVSGQLDSASSANSVTGAQSLRFSISGKIQQVPGYAEEALAQYYSDSYKSTAFSIIDTMIAVSDFEIVDVLNALLVDSIKSESEGSFELGLPEVSESFAAEYSFNKQSHRRRKPDLYIDDFREELGEDLEKLTVEGLKEFKVNAFWDAKGKTSYSLYRLLIGTLEHDSKLYAIDEGSWYCVSDGFKTSIDNSFDHCANHNPIDFKWAKVCDEGATTASGKGVKFKRESEYNDEASNHYGFVNLDCDLFRFSEGSIYDKFEGCDQLDIEGRRIIHVKKGGRKSSLLSHLFNQGMVSAKALKQPRYWEELCQKLIKLDVSEPRVEDVRNNPPRKTDWTVEFQIADSKLDNGKFNIPFFSRVAFDQVRNELVGFDYDVAIRFIDLDAKSGSAVARAIDIDDLPEEDDFNVLE